MVFICVYYKQIRFESDKIYQESAVMLSKAGFWRAGVPLSPKSETAAPVRACDGSGRRVLGKKVVSTRPVSSRLRRSEIPLHAPETIDRQTGKPENPAK